MTTLVPPASPTLGNGWSDTATVSGVFGGGPPLGSVSFYVCQASTSPSSTSTCTYTDGDGTLVGTVSTPSSTTDVLATYDLAPTTYTPTSAGTYCFYTLYTPSTGNYNPVWGHPECFGVSACGDRDDHAHLGQCHRRRRDGLRHGDGDGRQLPRRPDGHRHLLQLRGDQLGRLHGRHRDPRHDGVTESGRPSRRAAASPRPRRHL